MKGKAPLFSSASPSWSTPADLYRELDREFRFDLDPCPLGDFAGPLFDKDGLLASWKGRRVFCNPPYGPKIADFLAKAHEADLAVFLVPARTDTRWWHRYAMSATEIRFVRGRLKFGGSRNSAPFPSVVLVFGAPADREVGR